MTTLLCVGLCRRRKPREDFRETPWHGRAAECRDCDRTRYVDELAARDRWLLEQERAKSRMLLRHIQRLRLQRLVSPETTAIRAADGRLLRILTEPLPEPERRQKRARLTLTLERGR
jgi:hypothetical protein